MHTGPVPGHLVVVEVDEYWQASGHGNPAEDSHLQEKCPCNRTKSDSNPLGDNEVWCEEN